MKNISLLILSVFTTSILFQQSDNCSNAMQVIPSLTYCNYQTGSSANATQSLPGCSGNADDDVWLYFIANSTEMTIKVDPTINYDAVIQVFDGSCSGTSLGCRDVNPAGLDETLTLTGLTVGNTYYFRVYDYRAGWGSATFRYCVYGLAPTTNIAPCAAFLLPDVIPACQYATFSTITHPGSPVPTPSNCGGTSPYQGGYTGGDVWFKVVVPASGKLEISTLPIAFADGAAALYSGSSCTSLTQVSCSDDRDPINNKFMPYIYETGLNPGDTMYIRVWDYNNNSNGKFKICVSTPDNDDCVDALHICDLNGYGGTTSPQYTIDNPDNMRGTGEVPPGVFGTGYTGTSPVQIDNNSWITFTASASTATFIVDVEDCLFSNDPANSGVQMQIFQGNNCTAFVPVSNFVETNTSQTLTATGLVVGQDYYIVIDGFKGDHCSYTITAATGVQVVTASASDTSICVGNNVTITANVFGTGSYTYNWYSIPPGGPYPNSASFTDNPSTTIEYFVDISGLCGSTTSASVKVYVNPLPNAPSVNASPTTICPNDSSIITASGTNGATYNVYDQATGGTLLGTTPYTYAAGGFIGTKTFYVEAVSADSCVSTTRTPVTITSNDNQPPQITCPQNATVNVDANCEFIIPNYTGQTSATDNCTPTNQIVITQSPAPGTVVSGHGTVHAITMTATDQFNNSSNCVFTITLRDITLPNITCPQNQNIQVDSSCQAIVPDYTGQATVSDNCTPVNSLVVTQTPAPGTIISGIGTVTQVTLTVNDGNNNQSSCSFTITLFDATPPIITCPVDQKDTLDTEGCLYVIKDYRTWANLVSDNCDNNTDTSNMTQTPAPGTVIDLSQSDQSFIVTLTYTDQSGNQSTCTFNVDAVCIREIEIPQFFSPNGDPHNQYFYIKALSIYPENRLKVFNRWGSLVYEKENYDNSWDGKTNVESVKMGSGNEILPSGTYFYILELKDDEAKTGYVHMQR